MKKKLCIIALSLLVICSLFVINASVSEAWILEVKGTGQLADVSSVKIGVDPNSGTYPYPPSPPPDFSVVLKVVGVDDSYSEDIRALSGAAQEVWLVTVMMGGTSFGGKADSSQPGFFPVLSWDPNEIGPAEVMDLRIGDENGATILDMRTANTYQTQEADISDPTINYIPNPPILSYALIEYAIVFEPSEEPPVGQWWYRDADGDSYGDPNDSIQAEVQPGGYVANSEECDDSDPNTYPNAVEICDGRDNNCDGFVPVNELDDDGDGLSECQGDCDDTDNTVYPGAAELCDGIDNDCNGVIDDPDALTYNDYYRDADGDGYGDLNDSQNDCVQPPGYILDSTDCDDTDADTHPGATELCDGKDNDCNGTVPENEADADGDGFRICENDCDDTDADTYPGARELCDGRDNDCNGTVTENEVDADSDGFMICENDCDDTNPAINPGAAELCDGIDNDCNGVIDDPNALVYNNYYRDADSDGYGDINDSQYDCVQPAGYILDSTDCDDADPNINPGAAELCDGIDNDCNGVVDDPSVLTYNNYYLDADEDGYGDPNDSQYDCSQPAGYVLDSTDCDDMDAAINPAAEEVYDGIDNNCDGLIDENCYFINDLIATGQYYDGNSQTVAVLFGLDSTSPEATRDPNNWADEIVRLQLIEDPNNIVEEDLLISDIREASGQTTIAWYIMVEIGDTADPNQPGYYPVLSWDPNNLGCTEVDGDDYVYELRRGLGDSGTVLVNNMADTNSYQTVSQDGDPVQYFTILWTQAPAPPKPPAKPSQQLFPWPGVYPGAVGWGGIPFSAGFPGGLPYPMRSGYAPGLSIPSFPGTYTGFVYPGGINPWTSSAWTSYVPRFPATFPAVGIFSPVGQYGWSSNYWSGYPSTYLYQTGWFYTY